jgi:hypothetical protein
MIKGIAYKKVEMTEEEFKYYEELLKQFTDDSHKASDYFVDLFETDADGKITIIKPIKSIPWSILFFIQNLMINQHLRSYDNRIQNIENSLTAKG